MGYTKPKIVNKILFWFDVDMHDVYYRQHENVKAAQAFSVICKVLCDEKLFFTQSLTHQELCNYLGYFNDEQIANAIYNHSAYLNNSRHYPVIYNSVLQKANQLVNQNYEVSNN